MKEICITAKEAARFILYKQGLFGGYRFSGKDGVVEYIRQAGCIQFDPIDVCGRNPEIVLQSRIKGFTRAMLYELLYEDRRLLDHFDKNMAIIPVENRKYYARQRIYTDVRSYEQILRVRGMIKDTIRQKGPVCSADLDIDEKVDWYWDRTKLSRAALEHMYYCGELTVHHKKGSIKYYDLTENCIPADILNAPEPYPDDHDYRKWRVLTRIGSVGLLWNRPSDAWLGISDMKAPERNRIFEELLSDSLIRAVRAEGIDHTLYCLEEDVHIFDIIGDMKTRGRCEFIAPLDNMMWDRELVKAVWGFDYKWEIYTPQAQRKYGYYVLPVLYGDRFIGRTEMSYNKKDRKLDVLNIWYEPGIKVSAAMQKSVADAVKRYERFCRS